MQQIAAVFAALEPVMRPLALTMELGVFEPSLGLVQYARADRDLGGARPRQRSGGRGRRAAVHARRREDDLRAAAQCLVEAGWATVA